MYARISKISAVNEMQLNMFIETYKNVGAKTAMKAGALQLTITKIEKEKAYLIAVFPNKKVATERFQGIQDNLKQVKEFIKIEISEGEVVFNQNSLTHNK